ncbi:MAG: ctpB 2 [Firmicutes bacterium]|nr:ctpB 2 [Bacillota bacterium]
MERCIKTSPNACSFIAVIHICSCKSPCMGVGEDSESLNLEEDVMRWVRNSKIIISFLAMSMALSGSSLKANGIQNDAPVRIYQEMTTNLASFPVVSGDKDDLVKIDSMNKINWYLSQMDVTNLAATLKLLRLKKLLKLGYVGDVSDDVLMSGAIKGMVNSIGDPYSIYMDTNMYNDLMLETKGTFGGVGIVLGSKDNVLTVVAPIEGTPSDKAGIMSGDQVIKIDGQDSKGLAVDEAVKMIRGSEGGHVTLTINRVGQEIKDYIIMRSNIKMNTVGGKILDDGIGYVRLSIFNENTGSDLAEKLHELEGKGVKGIILDLRNNPGGLLEESIKVASNFVPHGPVVSVVNKDGRSTTWLSTLEAIKYPLVILVNGGSASASEIVAGAVQDTGVGTLIGTKTFGKGSVQTVLPLNDGSALKLTIAKYVTPNNRLINGVGLEPDIKVEMHDIQEKGKDLQLEKAIEVLKEKM